jgi:hypothetical protein
MENSLAASPDGSADLMPAGGAQKRQEALQEYYFAQDLIDRYDERCLKIKSWSVTSCGVALGFGLVENSSVLFGLAAFGSLVFWYMEGMWKARQSIIIQRAYALEDLFAQGCENYSGPRLGNNFKALWDRTRAGSLSRTLQYRSVRLPHFFIFCVGVLMFLGSLLNAKLQTIITP